jgi:hypothetical protein
MRPCALKVREQLGNFAVGQDSGFTVQHVRLGGDAGDQPLEPLLSAATARESCGSLARPGDHHGLRREAGLPLSSCGLVAGE